MKITYEKQSGILIKKYELNEIERKIINQIKINGSIYFRELKYGEKNPLDESQQFYFEDCRDLIGQEFISEHYNRLYHYCLDELGLEYYK